MKLFSGTISTIEHALDYSSLKQKVISQNIANADTPNYKAKDVSFKEVFQQAVNGSLEANKSGSRHFDFKGRPSSAQGVVTKRNVSYNHNGNSVDLDKEMSDLATNQIYYNAMIERMSGKFSSLQNVIRGGK
ncbi:flagellar basal body rod protein FlgB [Cytobacillus oceanisediminis]|uniref:Flagellar basal body rod protein FlgB n=1 Tax=Cytobacillus oceanisediminis TaxID=665099 RepID=A0A562JVZ5_9BACI|nr:flagellar basal body rod protein FlgB [Cytobacillus oceanisediminis]TWH87348.1 flagellar basal-body rod protein FlgB [Cytobacillus oceanisediminis]